MATLALAPPVAGAAHDGSASLVCAVNTLALFGACTTP